jgi:beta-glucosidase
LNDDEQIAAGALAVVSRVEARLPDAEILLIGLLPKHPDGQHPIRQRIAHINTLLRAGAQARDVRFIDVGHVLMEPDGSLSKHVMPDGLHLSGKGYALFADAIAPALDPMLAQ